MGLSRTDLCWIYSYLLNREQQVLNKNDISDWVRTKLGVPQESVLGPLLFCLYINDVHLFNINYINRVLYDDDLQIYVQVPYDGQLKEGIDRMSVAAQAVSDWAAATGPRLNPGKTQATFFTTERRVDRINKMNLPDIVLGSGVIVPFAKTVTSIGVVLDRTLS